MSGRVRVTLADGRAVTGYRKTLRRQTKRSLPERIEALNEKWAKRTPTRWVPDVRVGFLLPKDLGAFVATGGHGLGVHVHRGGFVQITHGSTEQCFLKASEFFAVIARQRPPFTVFASVICVGRPDGRRGRFFTVVEGALVVSSGHVEPIVYRAKAA